jgi:hypothetical protein
VKLLKYFLIYRRMFMKNLRALDPIYPRMLKGPPPPDDHVNTTYQSFQYRVLALLNMAMEDHPFASMALTIVSQDPSIATRLSLLNVVCTVR